MYEPLIAAGAVVLTWALSSLIGRLVQGKEKLFHTSAGIATVMVPLVNRYTPKNGEICIVGADGDYVSDPEKNWEKALLEWVDAGNRIEYVLLTPSKKARRDLLRLEKSSKERLKVYVPNLDEDAKSERAKCLMKKYRTYHFVLFEDPQQMWIEGHHPAGTTTAENCEYVPPRKANGDPRFDRLRENFAIVKGGCVELATA